jgi:hypothetical protein
MRVPALTFPVRGATEFVATMPVPASPSGGHIGIPGCSRTGRTSAATLRRRADLGRRPRRVGAESFGGLAGVAMRGSLEALESRTSLAVGLVSFRPAVPLCRSRRRGVVGVVRYIGMDVHREFAQLAVVEDGLVRDEAGSRSRRRRCEAGRLIFASMIITRALASTKPSSGKRPRT